MGEQYKVKEEAILSKSPSKSSESSEMKQEIKYDTETKNEFNKKKRKIPIKIIFFGIIYIIAIIVMIKNFQVNNLILKEKLHNIVLKLFEKDEIKLDILKSIVEKPEIYAPAEIKNSSKFVFNKDISKDYYEKPISLKNVLTELRNKEYLSNIESSETLKKIEKTIQELDKVSPMDKLLNSQKENFHNIKSKLDEEKYNLIEPDLKKIIDELELKNNLIDKYLANSETSYKMSIISLIFATLSLVPLLLGLFNMSKTFCKFIIVKFKAKRTEGER